MTLYTGINHLAMVTCNMERTIRFWRDLLGMRLIGGLGSKGYRHYFFEISERDMIAFFEWPDVETVPEKDHGVPVRGPISFDHVSIAVETDADGFVVITESVSSRGMTSLSSLPARRHSPTSAASCVYPLPANGSSISCPSPPL